MRDRRNEQASGGKKGPAPSRGSSDPLTFALSLAVLLALVFAFKSTVVDSNNIPSGSMIPTLKIGDYLFVNRMRYSLRLPFLGNELFRIDDPQRGDVITFVPPVNDTVHWVKRVIGMPGDRIRIRVLSVCSPDIKIKRAEKPDYGCSRSATEYIRIPDIAYVEYKEKDAGDWQHFEIEELGGDFAREVLTDADDDHALPPDVFGGGNRYLPVVFREKIGKHEHLFVEMSDPSRADGLCPTIETSGCVVPDGHYFVMGDNRDDSKDSRFRDVGYIGRERIMGKPIVLYFSIDWRDRICNSFMQNYSGSDDGLHLPGFPPEKQRRYCSLRDQLAAGNQEGFAAYLIRTLFYRIPRMSVRFKRIGSLVE